MIVLTPKPAICEFWWGWEAKEGLLPTPVLPLGSKGGFPKPGLIQPAICEFWWAHFDMLEHHLGDVVVPRDTQQHTLGPRCHFLSIFCQFGVPLGTHLECILPTFLGLGHQFCCRRFKVTFLVILEWISCQDPMLESA